VFKKQARDKPGESRASLRRRNLLSVVALRYQTGEFRVPLKPSNGHFAAPLRQASIPSLSATAGNARAAAGTKQDAAGCTLMQKLGGEISLCGLPFFP
jgi:hypothetical protein